MHIGVLQYVVCTYILRHYTFCFKYLLFTGDYLPVGFYLPLSPILLSVSLLSFCLSLSYPSVCLPVSPILLSVSPILLSVYPISLSFCLSLSPIPLSVSPNLLSACLSYPSVCLSLLSLCLSILSPRPSVYICLPVCFSTPLTATHKDK